MNQKVRHDLSSPCPYCSAGPHYVCGHLPVAATSRIQQADVDATVLEKMISNTWDHFGDILPTLKMISRGDWYWGANQRCKYIEIRIDTRDGGCLLFDSKRVRISPEQFSYQSYPVCKMDPWPNRNALDAAPAAKFKVGDLVTKTKGSQWTGRVVGTYSTTLTPEGYAVESSTERGSVQIYPAAALELVEEAQAEQSAITPESGTPPAEQQVQTGAVYAELPEPTTHQIAELKACEHGDAIVGWRVEPSRQSFHASMHPKRTLYTTEQARNFADRTHALRVAAAPQAAPGDGWRLVPVTPTIEMIDAALSVDPAHESVWAAYLSAAPQPAPTAQAAERAPAPQQEAQEPYGYVFAEQYAPIVGSELKTTREVFTKTKPDRQCLALYTAPQPAPAPLSRDQIREVFMAHGFTIKEGQTDLKQYVYDAAYALLGTKPAPLSEREDIAMIDAAMVEMANIVPPLKRSECARLIRAALAAQGDKA